LDECNVLKVEK